LYTLIIRCLTFETSSNLAQFLPTNLVALFMYTNTSQEVVQGGGLDKQLF